MSAGKKIKKQKKKMDACIAGSWKSCIFAIDN